MNVNKNFKDSVFIALFKEPALLRELYCALRGITLPPDAPVSINTLKMWCIWIYTMTSLLRLPESWLC